MSKGYSPPPSADEVLLGSFVTAEATVKHLKRRDPAVVSLVAMGWEGEYEAIEDELCAEYLEARLRGGHPDFAEMARRIRADPQGAKFFDPTQTSFREGDFHAAMSLDRFNFALRVAKDVPMRIEKA